MKHTKKKIGVGGLEISDYEKQLVNEVLNSNRLTYGPVTKKFEEAFAKLHDCEFALFMNSGTSALHVALAAFKAMHGWHDGDEVLVPSVTFVATSNIVLHNNMTPIFVDVEPLTYNIDWTKIEEKITSKTRAIIPVHLLGLPATMNPILELSKKYNLKIIEDSAECMFATYNDRKVGSLGDVAAFSTYVAHFLVTGVGGFATTSDPDLAVTMRSLMNHGRDSIYISCSDDEGLGQEKLHEVVAKRFMFVHVGHSFRCTELEAALGLGQLERKEDIISRRQDNAKYLTKHLSSLEEYIQLPTCPSDRTHAYMLYGVVVRNDSKRNLVNYLEDHNIETRDLLPLVNQPIYRRLYGDLEEELPVAKWINNSGFYIGCHSYLSIEELDYVISVFHDFFKKHT
jgi:dTDP-4-amino-4,6-dideoxygalactose transaminase